jgi:hypothetical protein
MGDGHNFKQLQKHILSLSKATDWETARKEWGFTDVVEAEEPDTCPCGHFPIVELCQISNRITYRSTEVGNRYVRRFLGVRSDLIFSAIKSIRKDNSKSLNADAIAFFHGRGVLNNWEYAFLQDTMRTRSLSAAQSAKRKSISEKVLSAVVRRGFRGPD